MWVCKENSNHERRKALVSLKRTPLSLVEEALLAHRRGPSGRQLGLFFLAIRNSLISLWIWTCFVRSFFFVLDNSPLNM